MFHAAADSALIDVETAKQIELLFCNMNPKSKHSLFGILNKCYTPGGSRLENNWKCRKLGIIVLMIILYSQISSGQPLPSADKEGNDRRSTRSDRRVDRQTWNLFLLAIRCQPLLRYRSAAFALRLHSAGHKYSLAAGSGTPAEPGYWSKTCSRASGAAANDIRGHGIETHG